MLGWRDDHKVHKDKDEDGQRKCAADCDADDGPSLDELWVVLPLTMSVLSEQGHMCLFTICLGKFELLVCQVARGVTFPPKTHREVCHDAVEGQLLVVRLLGLAGMTRHDGKLDPANVPRQPKAPLCPPNVGVVFPQGELVGDVQVLHDTVVVCWFKLVGTNLDRS